MKLYAILLLAFTPRVLAFVIATSTGQASDSLGEAITVQETSGTSRATVTQPTPTVATKVVHKFVPSPLITIAPLSRNPLELRQRCFDDRGFSVDCATWTGYYYTWGGAGHPYAGGPGDGGSGSGSGSGSGTGNGAGSIFIGGTNRLRIFLTSVLGCLLIPLMTMLL